MVDMLFSSSGIEPEIVHDAQRLEIFPKVMVSVASTSHLLAMKVLAANERDRPQDIGDIQSLLQVSSNDERNSAREHLQLIELRGANRGKDLLREFEEYVTRFLI